MEIGNQFLKVPKVCQVSDKCISWMCGHKHKYYYSSWIRRLCKTIVCAHPIHMQSAHVNLLSLMNTNQAKNTALLISLQGWCDLGMFWNLDRCKMFFATHYFSCTIVIIVRTQVTWVLITGSFPNMLFEKHYVITLNWFGADILQERTYILKENNPLGGVEDAVAGAGLLKKGAEYGGV